MLKCGGINRLVFSKKKRRFHLDILIIFQSSHSCICRMAMLSPLLSSMNYLLAIFSLFINWIKLSATVQEFSCLMLFVTNAKSHNCISRIHKQQNTNWSQKWLSSDVTLSLKIAFLELFLQISLSLFRAYFLELCKSNHVLSSLRPNLDNFGQFGFQLSHLSRHSQERESCNIGKNQLIQT